MASRSQGITVEIGGGTTKLSKALEGVNKSIKGMQSGLKNVNKLLKLDPSNTELVVQKQKMLKDAIQATFHTIDGIDLCQFFLPTQNPRIARSDALLSIGTSPSVRKTRSSTVKVLLRVFYCLALYASPHARMESRMGFRLFPSSVREYSTLGGTSA